MKEKDVIEKFCDDLCYALEIDRNKVKVNDLGMPHKAETLPKGSMAVYMFKYKEHYLKIGKAGNKSNPRFQYQHYLPNSSKSNLAKKILENKDKYNSSLNSNNIKEWMEKNIHRIDIIFDNSLKPFVKDVFETTLHYRFEPTYEGKIEIQY